jgi:spermidine/putrescine transport system permease protein
MGRGEVDVTVERGIWRALALPGVVWLILFIVVPAYAVLAVAMGEIDTLLQPVPIWNPLDWNVGFVKEAFTSVVPGGVYWPATRNTFLFVGATVALCFAIGYPVAYYIACHAKRTKGLLLLLIFLPFWVSYLMRMLAWIGLLAPDGYVNQSLDTFGVVDPPEWLNGNPFSVIAALTYGYIPYFILPVYAGLDRIDGNLLEGARDLGASALHTFLRVTLPLSWPSILAGMVLITLPMFGDYYTNDLISGSPSTNMLGNSVNLLVQGGSQKNLGAAMVLVLMTLLAIGMLYYLWQTARQEGRRGA